MRNPRTAAAFVCAAVFTNAFLTGAPANGLEALTDMARRQHGSDLLRDTDRFDVATTERRTLPASIPASESAVLRAL